MTAQEAYFSDYSTYAAAVGNITGAPYNFSFSSGNTQQAVLACEWLDGDRDEHQHLERQHEQLPRPGRCGAASTLDGTIICP